jgi:hypothetical protein
MAMQRRYSFGLILRIRLAIGAVGSVPGTNAMIPSGK